MKRPDQILMWFDEIDKNDTIQVCFTDKRHRTQTYFINTGYTNKEEKKLLKKIGFMKISVNRSGSI